MDRKLTSESWTEFGKALNSSWTYYLLSKKPTYFYNHFFFLVGVPVWSATIIKSKLSFTSGKSILQPAFVRVLGLAWEQQRASRNIIKGRGIMDIYTAMSPLHNKWLNSSIHGACWIPMRDTEHSFLQRSASLVCIMYYHAKQISSYRTGTFCKGLFLSPTSPSKYHVHVGGEMGEV